MTGTVLIIEDDQGFAETIKLRAETEGLEAQIEIRDFADVSSSIADVGPDAIVLDLYQGDVHSGQKAGKPGWDRVWKESFVPLIFCSASRDDDLYEQAERHPLLRYVLKSEPESVKRVVECLRDLLPIGVRLKEVRRDLVSDTERTVQEALTLSVPHVLSRRTQSVEGNLLLRTAQRRLGALMRQKADESGEPVFAWEQYSFPPVGKHLLTGDILKSGGDDEMAPESYRIVLTPSCDLAQGKVSYILAAKCVGASTYWNACGLQKDPASVLGESAESRRRYERIEKGLNEPQFAGLKLLPQFSNLIPHMAVKFRDLEILSLKSDCEAKSADGLCYRRVASIESPYREQIVWAFLQVAGRPGLPNRNNREWIRGVLEDPAFQGKGDNDQGC